jgi:hypothetical protein
MLDFDGPADGIGGGGGDQEMGAGFGGDGCS